MKYCITLCTLLIVLLTGPNNMYPKPTTNTAPAVTAWLQRNDWPLAVMSVRQHAALIHDVSPAWYMPQPNGDVSPIPGAPVNDPALLDAVQRGHTPLCPLLMNTVKGKFDPSVVQAVLGDPAAESRHIAAIAQIVDANHYDGIMLDYENLDAATFAAFANFVKLLGGSLHAGGKTLAVTAQPKLFVPGNETAWRTIGQAVDAVHLMAYPEHSTGTGPGPIATLAWVEKSMKNALAVVSAEKLSLGIATYAISWKTKGNESGSWAALAMAAMENGAKPERNGADRALRIMQKDGVIWSEDAESIAQKIRLASQLGVHHVALWRLGGEDPAIWSTIKAM